MFGKIDYKKLMDEDPEFKKFIQEVVVEMFLSDKGGHDFLATVHSFYNIGMSVEQVSQWARNMKAGQ